jgi:hypothetical protein
MQKIKSPKLTKYRSKTRMTFEDNIKQLMQEWFNE